MANEDADDDEFFEDEYDYPSDMSDNESDIECLDETQNVLNEDEDSDQDERRERQRPPEDISKILESHGGSINLKEFITVKGNINSSQSPS